MCWSYRAHACSLSGEQVSGLAASLPPPPPAPLIPRFQSLHPWLGSGLWVQGFIAWVTLPLVSGVRVVACIRCSMFGLTALWACLLALDSLCHTPFTQWSPGHGGLKVRVVKGQPVWLLPPTMASYSVLRIKKPHWVQAV